MDPTTVLRSDSYRPFATIIAPAALALAPWTLVAHEYIAAVRSFWDHHSIAAGVALLILSLAAGLILEDLGADLESRIDKARRERDAGEEDYWWRYLRLQLHPDPIGQRYLRAVLFRYKFELSFCWSIPFQVAGWLLLAWLSGAGWLSYLGTALVGLAIWWWSRNEADSSAELLARVRKELVETYEPRERGSAP